ncbi:MAG: 2-hydroxyacid dehydrogenase, partial [Paracoccaceae bacterium]|nr:2-hydroxyacid dehydrogenase [Paracoccaceae bacterium]
MTDLLLIGGATPEMLQRLERAFTIHHLAEMKEPKAWLTENGTRIHYIATNGHDGVKADDMAVMPNLKAISCYGVGYDAIDTTIARARGVVVTNTPNVLNAEVASTALMLMLACYRNLLADDAHVR